MFSRSSRWWSYHELPAHTDISKGIFFTWCSGTKVNPAHCAPSLAQPLTIPAAQGRGRGFLCRHKDSLPSTMHLETLPAWQHHQLLQTWLKPSWSFRLFISCCHSSQVLTCFSGVVLRPPNNSVALPLGKGEAGQPSQLAALQPVCSADPTGLCAISVETIHVMRMKDFRMLAQASFK